MTEKDFDALASSLRASLPKIPAKYRNLMFIGICRFLDSRNVPYVKAVFRSYVMKQPATAKATQP